MKILLVLFALFSTPFSSLKAQSDFAPLGATWTYSFADHIPFSYTYRPLVVSVNAIEMYQGRMCSRLDLLPVPPYGTASDAWTGSPLYLYEENDSVYYWSYYSLQFQLLYDFSAEVGESWVVGGLSVSDTSIFDDFLTVTIDSISTLVLDGDTLKVMHHDYVPFDWGNVVIERIGSNSFMLPVFGFYESRLGQLRCYNDMEGDYQFVPYPCDTVISNPLGSGREDRNQNFNIVLSPNPVLQTLQISTRDLISDGVVRIFDLQGHLLSTEAMGFPGSFDLSELAAGIYLCHITVGAQKYFVERIVKLK